jgi:hypothetical protein
MIGNVNQPVQPDTGLISIPTPVNHVKPPVDVAPMPKNVPVAHQNPTPTYITLNVSLNAQKDTIQKPENARNVTTLVKPVTLILMLIAPDVETTDSYIKDIVSMFVQLVFTVMLETELVNHVTRTVNNVNNLVTPN